MKYITFEKNEHRFNLLRPFYAKFISSFWIYEVHQLECDIESLPEELRESVVEISESVAKASWFSHLDLSQRKTMNIKVEQSIIFDYVKHSFNIPKNRILMPRDKFTYTITEEDEKNSVEYIKTILMHYVQKHFDSLTEKNKKRYSQKHDNIKKLIEECITNKDCLLLMHNHFGYDFIIHNLETKEGSTEPGAVWNLTSPTKSRPKLGPVTEQELNTGPTIHNIDPSVFQLKWEIGEPVKVEL